MIRHVSFMNNYFNFFIKLTFLSLILLISNSCGIYRPAPVKDVPTNVKDRVKKIKADWKSLDSAVMNRSGVSMFLSRHAVPGYGDITTFTDITELRSKERDLQKQEVLLELLGEKTEEADNLMVDIQEMKRMYRQQTESMLEQLAAATS